MGSDLVVAKLFIVFMPVEYTRVRSIISALKGAFVNEGLVTVSEDSREAEQRLPARGIATDRTRA